jgi:hypothetical protein
MIVLDANILIRAVLGRRVRQIIEAYASHGVHSYAPDVAFDDARKYLPPLLKKRGKPAALHREMTAWGRGCAYHGRHVASATPPSYSAGFGRILA